LQPINYLAGYPLAIQQQAAELMENGQLASYISNKYPQMHRIQSDKALYNYVTELKTNYMRNSTQLSQVRYDSKLNVLKQALGMHTFQSRVHGNKLKSHNSITIAALFKTAPPEFLRMIVVHELAHFKEKDHNKAFYQLCQHMEPHYHQLELDTRLWLMARDLQQTQAAIAPD
jgi:predicted metal-dependent hydrolase